MSFKPKYVASTTPTDPRWADTTVLSGDVAAAVRELLQAKPDLMAVATAPMQSFPVFAPPAEVESGLRLPRSATGERTWASPSAAYLTSTYGHQSPR